MRTLGEHLVHFTVRADETYVLVAPGPSKTRLDTIAARLDHLISGVPDLRTASFQARFHSNLPMWARITLRRSPAVLFIGRAVYALHRDQCQP